MDMPPPPPISVRGDPDPNITDPFDLWKPLDNYVKSFAPNHGYAIIVGHSGRAPHLYTNYDCHRSGRPAKRKVKNDINSTQSTKPATQGSNSDPPKKS